MKKKTIIIILSILVSLLVLSFLIIEVGKPYVENQKIKVYDQGVVQATLELAYIQTTNSVLYYLNESGTLNSIGLNDYCGGLVGQ